MEFGKLLKSLSTLKYVVIVRLVNFFCCNGALVGAPFFNIGKKQNDITMLIYFYCR